MVKKSLERIYLILIFLFLYLPIAVLVILSFNDSKSRVMWGGFTFKWYRKLLESSMIMEAFQTTIVVTLSASLIILL